MTDTSRQGFFRLPGRVPRIFAEIGSFVTFAVKRFYADGLGQAAGALTYSTLLALVPLLVIMFAILSGFPAFDSVRERMEAIFFDTLVPEAGAEAERYLTQFSENASNLTAVGIVGLTVTAVLLLWTIEATLNQVWRVERQRPIAVRLLIFWTLLTLGPLLLGASFALSSNTLTNALRWAETGVSTSVFSVSPSALDSLVAVIAQSLAFTLLFLLVPARPVQWHHAAIGGVIAGVAFQVLRWAFNSFLTAGSTYDTIYGAVAVIPIFLVWIYASWTVIIFGAVFAAAFPDWWKTRDPLPGGELSPARRLEVAMALLSVLAQQARQGGGVTQARLQDAAPLEGRDDMIEALIRQDYVVTTENDCLALSRDIYTTRVGDLARDLGLSLGLDPGETREDGHGAAAFSKVEEATGGLPRLLCRLHEAEGRILDRPIADVLTTADEESGAPLATRIGGRSS